MKENPTEAIAKKYQIVLIIDDYTAIHNIRRPTTIQSCNPKSTCTILVKLFRNILAIPACPVTNYHSLKALDIPIQYSEFAREALIRSVFLHIAHITAAFFPLWTSLSPRRQALNRSSDFDIFISRLSRTCHATFVLAVIDSCASDPRSAIRGQRLATTESPPVCKTLPL